MAINMIGRRIRELRLAKGISSEKLGELTGTSGANIRRYELDEQKLTLEWIVRLANGIGCHPADLLPERFKDQVKEHVRLQRRQVLEHFMDMPFSGHEIADGITEH